MRTDGSQMNFPDSGNMRNDKMERAHMNRKQEFAQGFGIKMNEYSKNSFRERYSQIAKSNRNAKDNTEKNTDIKNTSDLIICEQVHDPVGNAKTEEDSLEKIYRKIINQIEDKSDSETESTISKEMASETIQEALTNISSELNFNIDKDIDKLTFENELSNESINYMAEIITLLKDIVNYLDNAAGNNESVEIGNKIIDTQNIGEISACIRKNMLKIEIALNMLNISSEMAQKLSEISDQKFTGNIPQAKNPSEMSMPVQQAQKLFDDLVKNPDAEVKSLIKKISSLINENVDQKQISVSMQTEVNSRKELERFDTQTYRQMLKLENKQETVIENTEAAKGNEKMNLPGVSEAFATEINELKDDTADIKSLLSSQSGVKPVIPNGSQIIETKLTNALGRTLDESIMNQVNEKLNTVIRSGINEVRIQLRPESLGEVKCQIRMEGDIVIARFQVESQQVKQIIESNMQSLKDTLAQQNLQAGSFDVNVGDGWNKDGNEYETGNSNYRNGKRVTDSSDYNENTSNNESSEVFLGTETGKRYGNNSVEFFG